MVQPGKKSFKIVPFFLSYTFVISYILSIVSIIIFGYFFTKDREIKEYKQLTSREIESYKQLTFWYENLNTETQHREIFSDFIKKAQGKIKKDYENYFKTTTETRLTRDIKTKIIVDDDNLPPTEKQTRWDIGKTEGFVNVYYEYFGIIDFDNLDLINLDLINIDLSNQELSNEQKQVLEKYFGKIDLKNIQSINKKRKDNRDTKKEKILNDRFFKNFAYLIQQLEIEEKLKETKSDNDINNLHIFSKFWINYLTDTDKEKEKFSDTIPHLRINNVYLFNVDKGFFITYPLTSEGYDAANYRTRPWFKATINDYDSSFQITDRYNNTSGLTAPYIDIIDKTKVNVIRTLWYKFRDRSNKEYILCFDLFLDKSSQIGNKNILIDLPELTIEPGNWVYLLAGSFIIALCFSLIYKLILKNIIIRISKHHANDLVKIKMVLERKHYATKDEEEIRFTIQGESKDINQSEKSREARWSFNIQGIQVGFSNNQIHTTQEEATSRYEFTNEYNLNMSKSKPQYKCIETWRVVSESQSGKTQKIGFFVAKWSTNNNANIEEGLDIKSIYWEKEYEEYLGIFKQQLHEHLLISDEKELVAVLDRNYSRRQNIPEFITGIDNLKKIINSSSYLKQGKIVFSEVETLTDVYKEGMVNAICTLHFLKKLSDAKKLKTFLQTQVNERYLIEYQQGEFYNFYNSLDDETKSELINQSPFKIMVYQENIDNIASPQDDFCLISINNTLKLVAYTFTDNKFSNTGWISWREVDIKFYDELYRCQKDKNHRIVDIRTYLDNTPNN